jgi:hypothetical protein
VAPFIFVPTILRHENTILTETSRGSAKIRRLFAPVPLLSFFSDIPFAASPHLTGMELETSCQLLTVELSRAPVDKYEIKNQKKTVLKKGKDSLFITTEILRSSSHV